MGFGVAQEGPQTTGLAGRYATAVLELAQETGQVDALEKDLVDLKAMMAASADLSRLVKAPVFSSEQQSKAMKALLEKSGSSALTTKFILMLASKRRLFALADIIRAFEAQLARQRGEVQASVTSARKLSDGETDEIKNILKSKLGREPRLETQVDPSLLGGLVVKVGSRMIDSSLRTKLSGIRAAMRGN